MLRYATGERVEANDEVVLRAKPASEQFVVIEDQPNGLCKIRSFAHEKESGKRIELDYFDEVHCENLILVKKSH